MFTANECKYIVIDTFVEINTFVGRTFVASPSCTDSCRGYNCTTVASFARRQIRSGKTRTSRKESDAEKESGATVAPDKITTTTTAEQVSKLY